jgi:glycerol kinase
MAYILAVDQGTTSTTTFIVNAHGDIVGSGSAHLQQRYPKPGWVEHDGNDIKEAVRTSVRQALTHAGINSHEIRALGLTNQRETVGLFDKNNTALTNFIVWQCRRSDRICEKLKQKNLETELHAITGLYLDPYFSASKLAWIFENNPELRSKAQKREILVGTVDSFLVHWFTNGARHLTDITNASRTMLMNLKTGHWDARCLEIFDVPEACLPQITKNIGNFGVTKNLDFLPDDIPITALAGDQHAALFGQACFDPGDAKATFGTGCFILLNTGTEPIFSHHGLVTSIAYQLDDQKIYCLEGSVFIAGAAIEFLINAFGLAQTPQEIQKLAETCTSSDGVIFIPALVGLGAPHWQPHARGAFFGLTRGTSKGNIARAALEGIALQNTDICRAMAEDAGVLKQLKVDGGASADNLLMQVHADLLNLRCVRTATTQKTAMGVAYMAGLAIGMFENLEKIRKLDKVSKEFFPNQDRSWANKIIQAYHEAIKKLYD